MRILVIEDDRRLADVIQRGLVEDGYDVDLQLDGDGGQWAALSTPHDAIVLDVMLPGIDGFTVCRNLRSQGVRTPILMLTARDTVDDTVEGLESGADDYMRKPFAFRELRARIHALTRRGSDQAMTPRVVFGNLSLDSDRREVIHSGTRISLTNREFGILSYLMQHPGKVLTRIMIEDHVWGHAYPGLSNTVDVHIRRLRSKLDRPEEPSPIETVRGVGYRLRTDRM